MNVVCASSIATCSIVNTLTPDNANCQIQDVVSCQ